MSVLEAKHIDKFFVNATTTQVLNQVSFQIKRGEFVSIVGKSGCGKSTLLYILSTMDTDYSGELFLDGELITGKSAEYLSRLRNEKIGFVFQFHYLLHEFSTLENVMIPALKLNKKSKEEVELQIILEIQNMSINEHIVYI